MYVVRHRHVRIRRIERAGALLRVCGLAGARQRTNEALADAMLALDRLGQMRDGCGVVQDLTRRRGLRLGPRCRVERRRWRALR